MVNMKKVLYLLLCLGVISCSKDFDDQNTCSISASIDDEGLTKTYMDEGSQDIFHVLWSNGDEIAVSGNGAQFSRFSLSDGEGTRLASFLGPAFNSTSCIALYPYSMVQSVSGDSFRIRLPEEQYYAGNSFSSGAFPMIAVGSTENLKFHNLCSIIRLCIYGNAILEKIIFSPRDSQTFVAGDAVVSGDKLIMCENGNRDVILNLDGILLSEFENKTFDIVVPAQTYKNGFDVTVISKAGSIMKKSYDNSFTTEKSCIHFAKPFRFVPGQSSMAVDLGLSVKWSSCNICANSIEEMGYHTKWKELLKYNNSDHKTILDLEDDPAYVNWGGECRIPTLSEWDELLANCSYNPSGNDYINGKRGILFTSKINGNSIFLPICDADETLYASSEFSEVYNFCTFYRSYNLRSHGSFTRGFYETYFRPVFPPMEQSVLEITPQSYDIGMVEVGKSVDNYFTLHNLGGKDLSISSIEMPEDFSTDFSSGTIKGGENIVIKVTFSPKTIRRYDFTLNAVSDADVNGNAIISGEGFEASDSHETQFINLDLSVKWADRYLGASDIYSSGDPYAWGETETKNIFEWDNYKWGDLVHYLSKYVTKDYARYYTGIGYCDGKKQLDPEDDAAYVKLGNGYRMPTHFEIRELISNCSWETVRINGVSMYKVTSKKNKNRYIYVSSEFWSSSLADDRYAYYFMFTFQGECLQDERRTGKLIRAVKE